MNAIFTIAAKNYLPCARVLGDSLKRHLPEVPFFVILADKAEGLIDISKEPYTTIEAQDLGISGVKEMAFKYNVIEFCTSVKPFAFEYLFQKYGYTKVLYLDPDVCVYDSLDEIWDKLEKNFVVLTPHLLKPYVDYNGATPEEELLFVGIYNCGLIAFNNSATAKQILQWWKEKLRNQCYADKTDSLHVDQRWMDFLPALYETGICILRHPGYNVADWNWHERKFTDDGLEYKIDDIYKLKVFHFCGFNPFEPERMCLKQTRFSLDNSPQYKRLFKNYVQELLAKGYKEMSTCSYYYGKFSNGVAVANFQRRIYRGLLRDGWQCEDPFAVGSGSLFEILRRNRLIIKDGGDKLHRLTKTNVGHYGLKRRMTFSLFLFLKNLIGIKRYYMLMYFLSRNFRFEDQQFLVKKR